MPWLDWTGLTGSGAIHLVSAVSIVRVAWTCDVLGQAQRVSNTESLKLMHAGWVSVGGYNGGPAGNSSDSVSWWKFIEFESEQRVMEQGPLLCDCVQYFLQNGVELHLAAEYS